MSVLKVALVYLVDVLYHVLGLDNERYVDVVMTVERIGWIPDLSKFVFCEFCAIILLDMFYPVTLHMYVIKKKDEGIRISVILIDILPCYLSLSMHPLLKLCINIFPYLTSKLC